MLAKKGVFQHAVGTTGWEAVRKALVAECSLAGHGIQASSAGHGIGVVERSVNLPGDVALDFLLVPPFDDSFGDVVSCALMAAHPDDCDRVDGLVELAISATIGSVPGRAP